ncbi:hypothetical protein LCGC14_0607210 [marine sediment metagenome]|uniref:Uncharacterized protein n=1 Tax=marine sediment metagenome TaxID=412755 RepID=A0A0F9TV17_9ZZZZ
MGPGPIYSNKQEMQRKEYKKRLKLPCRCAPRDYISYEIATLPSVARNDTFIFYIIIESVTELLSNYNRSLFNEKSPVPLNQLFNIFSTSSLSTSRT